MMRPIDDPRSALLLLAKRVHDAIGDLPLYGAFGVIDNTDYFQIFERGIKELWLRTNRVMREMRLR